MTITKEISIDFNNNDILIKCTSDISIPAYRMYNSDPISTKYSMDEFLRVAEIGLKYYREKVENKMIKIKQ